MTNVVKTTILIFVCYGLCAANVLAEPQAEIQEANQPAYLKVVPAEKLREDLDFLFKTIEEVHPNMYAYTNQEEFDPLRQKLYGQINQPMTRMEFWKLIPPVLSSLKNGHLWLHTPRAELKEYINSGGIKFFPLEFRWDGRDLILTKDYGDDQLPIGGRVLTVNGEDAGQLIVKFARYMPRECKNGDPWSAARSFVYRLWFEYGPVESLNLTVRHLDGEKRSYTVQPIPFSEYEAAKANDQDHQKESYSYHYISEYDAALIDWNGFSGLAKFKEFLQDTFQEVRNKNATNLIIDIRDNGGGDSSLGDALLDYLTNKPFRQFEQIHTKISKQLLHLAGKTLEEVRKEFPGQHIDIGSILTEDQSFIEPGDNPWRFSGRTFVLVNHMTFSSAVAFASAVKCFDMGTLIGEETRDTTTNFGDLYSFTLPNSGLGGALAFKRFVHACGKPDGRGVIPDYDVKQKPEDTTKGIDTALEFTLNLIKNNEAEK